ncbi:MAG: hypothetical protein WC299_02110 [Kiritimatiellia bacterium]
MNVETKTKIAKLLALAIFLSGFAIITAWLFKAADLMAVFSWWIPMKFDTAIGFMLCGIILYFIARSIGGDFDVAQVALAITTLTMIMLMGTLFFSDLLEIHTGLEELFVKDNNHSGDYTIPGRPPLMTVVNFILIAAAGIMNMFNIAKLRLIMKLIGLAVAAIGTLALAGHCFNAPALYFAMGGLSSAMAVNSAVLFVLSGMGLICLSD